MLKNYFVNGVCRQYEEGTEPEGAIAVEPVKVEKAKAPEAKAVEHEKKAARTSNKSRGAKTK